MGGWNHIFGASLFMFLILLLANLDNIEVTAISDKIDDYDKQFDICELRKYTYFKKLIHYWMYQTLRKN